MVVVLGEVVVVGGVEDVSIERVDESVEDKDEVDVNVVDVSDAFVVEMVVDGNVVVVVLVIVPPHPLYAAINPDTSDVPRLLNEISNTCVLLGSLAMILSSVMSISLPTPTANTSATRWI